MTTRQTILAIALAIATASATSDTLLAQGGGVTIGEQKAVVAPPTKSAREALRAARSVEGGARGTIGEKRAEILTRAAEAYEKVAADFAHDLAAVAQASFSAAEIWRKQGELATAEQLYQESIRNDQARYQERALMQLAHIARRQEKPDEALDMYARVAGFKPASARAHEARIWTAKIYAGGEDKSKAVEAFELAVDGAGSPRRIIEACNGLAGLLIKMGQLVRAEEVLKRAEVASQAETGVRNGGDNLARAYLNMSAHKALQRAKDKRDKIHEQAEQVEKSIRSTFARLASRECRFRSR